MQQADEFGDCSIRMWQLYESGDLPDTPSSLESESISITTKALSRTFHASQTVHKL